MNEETYNRLWSECRKPFEATCVNYIPFIGRDYWTSSPRILVLGESHYSEKERRREKDLLHSYTFEVVVGEYLNQNWKYNFSSFKEFPKEQAKGIRKNFRRMANLLKTASEKDRNCDSVWDSLAFYNYFQRCVGTPKLHDHSWLDENKQVFQHEAEVLFFGMENKEKCVLNILKPKLVFVWGEYLKKMMPKPDGSVECWMNDIGCFAYSAYPSVLFYPICHPSNGKSWKHSEEIRKFEILNEKYLNFSITSIDVSIKNKIDEIYRRIHKVYKGKFEYKVSEVALTCILYAYESGTIRFNSKQTMQLEVKFDSNNIGVRFYTHDFSCCTAGNILMSSPFNLSTKEIPVCEGKYILLESTPMSLDDLFSVLRKFMDKMLKWRDNQIARSAIHV